MKFEWDEDKNIKNKEKHKKDTIRLISARLATDAERSLYYDQDIYY